MLDKIKFHLVITKFIKYLLLALVFFTVIIMSYYIIVNQDVKIRHQNDLPNQSNNDKEQVNLKINMIHFHF